MPSVGGPAVFPVAFSQEPIGCPPRCATYWPLFRPILRRDEPREANDASQNGYVSDRGVGRSGRLTQDRTPTRPRPPMPVATGMAMTLARMAMPWGSWLGLCRTATGLRIRRPRLLRGAGLCGWGPRRGLASARVAEQRGGQAQRRQQEQQNAAVHHQQVQQNQATYQRQVQENAAKYQQQVQQNQATYQRQVQENAAKYQQQVQQNQALVQQNAALYRQQVQQNTAIYQRQLLEAQQRKALGQQ